MKEWKTHFLLTYEEARVASGRSKFELMNFHGNSCTRCRCCEASLVPWRKDKTGRPVAHWQDLLPQEGRQEGWEAQISHSKRGSKTFTRLKQDFPQVTQRKQTRSSCRWNDIRSPVRLTCFFFLFQTLHSFDQSLERIPPTWAHVHNRDPEPHTVSSCKSVKKSSNSQSSDNYAVIKNKTDSITSPTLTEKTHNSDMTPPAARSPPPTLKCVSGSRPSQPARGTLAI